MILMQKRQTFCLFDYDNRNLITVFAIKYFQNSLFNLHHSSNFLISPRLEQQTFLVAHL